MEFKYGQFEGQPFPTPDSLFPQSQVVEFVLQHGQDALDYLDNVDPDDQVQELIQEMLDAGLLEEDPETGKLRMTPRMVRGIQHHSLLQIFEGMERGTREGHPTRAAGQSEERVDGTKPYTFGDKLSEIDLGTTMRNALARQQNEQRDPEGQGPRTDLPLNIDYRDFELHVTEGQADAALCILIDMSGSMMRYGRFYQAKRVALGMAELVRQRFPQDTVDYVGFHSLAERLQERDLPLVMPKPVSVYDPVVRLRTPLAQAQAQPEKLPLHFTNLQMGLRMARQILSRRGATNKQIFIITDGQPTAHIETAGSAYEGGGEEMLYLLYPPEERTSDVTLKEALRCHQQGIRVATFALVEDYWGMDWVGFIDQLTRLIRGTAFYCSSDDLASTVVESYLSGKRRKSHIA